MAVTDVLKKPVLKFDGVTLTVGIMLVAVIVWYFFFHKKG